MLKEGHTSEALEKLKPLADQDSKDQLIYLLDYATALQIAGQYKESNTYFLKADKLTDLNDYHSVSKVTASLLTSEEMVQYKGESYEKFLINTMLAINYLMLGELDEAMVESRRINDKLSKMKLDGRKPYELSPFANYLTGVLWEADQKWDDAYISYEQAYKLDATNPFIAPDLIRSAKKARRDEAYIQWKKEFPQIAENKEWYDKSLGEVVIIYQQGWGPEKHERPGSYRFPKLYPVFSETQFVKATLNGEGSYGSQTAYNIERVAIETLEDDFGALVARRVGGLVAKEVVADQIRQKNELLGFVAWVGMHVSDRADLRQWSTLPRSFQLIRIPVKAGSYKLNLQGYTGGGSPTSESYAQDIQVRSGRKTFVNWRSLK